MASINTIVKRKQYLWLGIVVVGAASAIGGALYLSDVDMAGNGEAVAEQEPVPDMTGVVDTTFDDKVRQHATTEMQVTAAQMQKQYEEIRRELDVLNKQRGDDQRRIEKLGQDNAALAEQVKALGANPVTATGEPTSLALVAVTTGPDMIKMLRGRISGAQFIRNLAVASSCVAGGAVRSVAGGILFSPLGPFGALTGRVVGGVLGGMIASAVSGKIAGALVSQISGVLSRWQQAKVARNGLDELMKRPVDQPEHGKLVHKAVLHGNYQFSNAIFYYDEEEKIADVAIGKLNIQAGEKIAILGRNGAGKSTLLQMLAGMRIAQQGQVLLDNISIGQLDPADLRRDMGLLSQTGRLFFGSLRENLTMGMPEASDEDIERALTLSGALPFVQKQKNGLNYMIQEGGFGLSGGQRQTLLLARLLISQPNIVLLDEPSASLDEMAEAYLIEQLKQWIGHRTLIIATHRTAMLQLVDRIIVMDQGRIVMDGAKEAILREQGEPTTRRVVLQEKNKGSAA